MKKMMKAKGMKRGGKTKSKGMARGGNAKKKMMKGGKAMKAKGMKRGGKMKAKGMKRGGKAKRLWHVVDYMPTSQPRNVASKPVAVRRCVSRVAKAHQQKATLSVLHRPQGNASGT